MSNTTFTDTDNTSIADSEKDSALDVTITEHLSALLDDEVGTFEQKRVLNELSSNDGMRNKLAAYSLIGETLRSGKPAAKVTMTTTPNFLSGIQDQLMDEPVYSEAVLQNNNPKQSNATNESNAKNEGSWLRPIGGFAMAASVAALAVIGFQNYFMPSNNNSVSQPTEIVAANSLAPLNSIENVTATGINTTSAITKDKLTESEMASAMVVTADQLQEPQSVDATTYLKADLQTRSLLKRYVDSHMQYASTTTFVPSVRVIAYSDY